MNPGSLWNLDLTYVEHTIVRPFKVVIRSIPSGKRSFAATALGGENRDSCKNTNRGVAGWLQYIGERESCHLRPKSLFENSPQRQIRRSSMLLMAI